MFLRTNRYRAVYFLPFLLLVISCAKEKEDKNYVARVNGSYLTSEDVENELSSLKYGKEYKDEFIHDWVKREALFQEAKKNKLVNGVEYQKLVEEAKKELAAALLLKQVADKFVIEPDEPELRDYYELHQAEFRVPADAFVMNRITFSEKERAINFRATVLDSGWTKALAMFSEDSAIVKTETEKFIYYYQIYPVSLIRYMKYLDPSETSVVFESEPNLFSVVQVKNKFREGEIPPFEDIKSDVKNKYIMIARADSLETYIENLMPQYNIEIKKD